MGMPERIWSISSIHGESERLMALHDCLLRVVRPGDRIVYHGNYIGHGTKGAQTIDELLTFRRLVLSIPGMMASDIVYLRGGQEEMWEKLQQLQFAPNPTHVIKWMLERGIGATLESYGLAVRDGITAAREGVMSITKWTRQMRETIKRRPGHEVFMTHLRRAAFTNFEAGKDNTPLLFVNAGIDPARALTEQGDNFWWSKKSFNAINLPYAPFGKIVRGFDPDHKGIHLNCVTATIDGGCGFGGSMVYAGFDRNGSVFDIVEA